MDPRYLDGNATAGTLDEFFAFDVTVAVTTCAGCRHSHAIAELRAYSEGPGIVLRCTSCDVVQLRVVRSPDRAWLDLSGVALVEIPTS
jgi:hypothetical protein